MDRNQFEQVVRRMIRRYGKMEKGYDEINVQLMLPLEENLLIVHRRDPACTTSRMKVAVCLVFYRIEEYLGAPKKDVSRFESAESIKLRDALLYAFDPFANRSVRAAFDQFGVDPENRAYMEHYFQMPVQCMLKILDSAEIWQDQLGSDGYFTFLENFLEERVPAGDDTLHFAAVLSLWDS